MKKITVIAAITVAFSFFQFTSAIAQDTKKDKSKKEAKKDDADEDDDLQPETANTETKVQKSNKHNKTSIGVEAGLNLANLTGNGTSGSSIAGLRAGGLVDVPVSDRLYIQPGIYYAMNGSADVAGSGADIRLNTIEVPVNLIYKFGKTGKNHIFVGIGLCYGYNISGKVNPGGYKLDIGSDPTDAIKASIISIGLNAGYELANGLFFRLGYLGGINNLDPVTASSGALHSSALNLQVGYYFGKNKKK